MPTDNQHPKTSTSGLTLLEVLIATAILGGTLLVISMGFGVNLAYGHRNKRIIAASFLMPGVVLDLEQEIREEEKDVERTNSIYNRECKLPKEFGRIFECRYDLEIIELEPEQLDTLMESAQAKLGGMMAGEDGEMKAPEEALQSFDQLDLSALVALMAMGGLEPDQALTICGLSYQTLVQNMFLLLGVFPQIVQIVSKKVRKLTVRISWEDGPEQKREISVSTFLVLLPMDGKGWDKK